MSDLQLKNLSNSKTTNCLTTEETTLITGGHSCAGLDFLKSAFGDIDFDDPGAVNDLLGKLNPEDPKPRKGGKKADNAEGFNVINGTPGDDVLIGN